jgi:outer membrane protein assembly factor BamB
MRWFLCSIVAVGMIVTFGGCTTHSVAPMTPTISPAQEHTIYYVKPDEQGNFTVSPFRSTVTSLDATNGKLRWQAHVDDETQLALTVAYGLVFVVVTSTVPNKSDALQAIDATSGKVRWTFRYPGPSRFPPIVACNLIVVAWATNEQPFQYIGIDPASGAIRWRYSGVSFGNYPSSQGNLLYFFADSQRNVGASADALNLCSGTIAWSQHIPAATSACFNSPVVAGNVAVAECVPTAALSMHPPQPVTPTFLAFNAETGALLWQGERGQSQIEPPVMLASGDNLYLRGNRIIQAYAIKTGKLLWQDQPAGSYIPLNFTVFGSGNLAFVIESPGLVARDAATGQMRWQFSGEIEEWYLNDSGGVLYLTNVPTVTALSLATGATLWQYHDQEATASFDSPQVVGDMLLLSRLTVPRPATQQSSLITLHRKDGKLAWQFDTGFYPAIPVIGP